MIRLRLLTLVMTIILVLVACEPSTDTATDDLSAQNQQPSLIDYQTTDLDVASDALLVAAGGSAVATGNAPLAAAIQRGDALLQCLQDTGSASGLMYVEENPTLIPQVGASLVVNKTRVQRNLFDCLTDTGFSAQSALDVEPCAVHGEFTSGGDEFFYAYVGVGSGICLGFEQHFSSFSPTILGEYPPATTP